MGDPAYGEKTNDNNDDDSHLALLSLDSPKRLPANFHTHTHTNSHRWWLCNTLQLYSGKYTRPSDGLTGVYFSD